MICCQAYFSVVVAALENAEPTQTVTMIKDLMLAKGFSLESFSLPL